LRLSGLTAALPPIELLEELKKRLYE